MTVKSRLTIAQTSKKYPIFTESALRNLISKASRNGLKKAIIRIGGRIYFDEFEFEAWLDRNGGQND